MSVAVDNIKFAKEKYMFVYKTDKNCSFLSKKLQKTPIHFISIEFCKGGFKQISIVSRYFFDAKNLGTFNLFSETPMEFTEQVNDSVANYFKQFPQLKIIAVNQFNSYITNYCKFINIGLDSKNVCLLELSHIVEVLKEMSILSRNSHLVMKTYLSYMHLYDPVINFTYTNESFKGCVKCFNLFQYSLRKLKVDVVNFDNIYYEIEQIPTDFSIEDQIVVCCFKEISNEEIYEISLGLMAKQNDTFQINDAAFVYLSIFSEKNSLYEKVKLYDRKYSMQQTMETLAKWQNGGAKVLLFMCSDQKKKFLKTFRQCATQGWFMTTGINFTQKWVHSVFGKSVDNYEEIWKNATRECEEQCVDCILHKENGGKECSGYVLYNFIKQMNFIKENIQKLQPNAFEVKEKSEKESFVPSVGSFPTCKLCKKPFEGNIKALLCGHTMCTNCFLSWFYDSNRSGCPLCGKPCGAGDAITIFG